MTPNPNQPPPPPPSKLLSTLPILPTWRLIKYFNGDRKAAERLLFSAQMKYPDRSEQWVQDKVAWDLWRDRGM